ncbi:hypothetical protein GCM10027341_28580 [Spirosoma knui]
MSELKQNLPEDDFWRKAFDEADETPPPRVWDAIERQLDESRGPRILPLWGTGLASSRPFVWGVGVAAAVAVLLMGWWALAPQTADQQIAQVKQIIPAETTAPVAVAPATKSPSAGQVPESAGSAIASAVAPSEKNPVAAAVSSARQHSPRLPEQQTSPSEAVAQYSTSKRQPSLTRENRTSGTASSAFLAAGRTQPTATMLPPAPDESRMSILAQNPSVHEVSTDAVASQAGLTVEQLTGKPLRLRSLGQIQRIVWFRPAELPTEATTDQAKREPRELWASVSMMPGSFNPAVSVRQAPMSFMNSIVPSNSRVDQSSVSSRANFSVAYQAGAGIQLSEHWSIESGVGYLTGHSAVESPGQTAVALIQSAGAERNSPTSNLYVDALRNSARNTMVANSPASSQDFFSSSNYVAQNSYSNQSQQVVTNNYQFVQVPVQVGYQLLPKKRLGIALMGGLLTNIFVRNTVADELVITAKDGIYRPVSLAATMGARFRYRPSRRWSASLSGVYQPSLSSGTQSNSQIDSRPTSTGMSFGVDYHF